MTNTPQVLRDWAKGILTCEAGAELLIRGFSGRFIQPGWPWMYADDEGRTWIEFEAIQEHIGGLSGGEKRFLRIAASLGGEDPVALSDVVPGLDRAILDLVRPPMPTLQVHTRTPRCSSSPRASSRSSGSTRCIRGRRKRLHFALSTVARNSTADDTA